MYVNILAVLEKSNKKIGGGDLKKSKLRNAILDLKLYRLAKEFIAELPSGESKRFTMEISQKYEANDKVIISLAKIKELHSANA